MGIQHSSNGSVWLLERLLIEIFPQFLTDCSEPWRARSALRARGILSCSSVVMYGGHSAYNSRFTCVQSTVKNLIHCKLYTRNCSVYSPRNLDTQNLCLHCAFSLIEISAADGLLRGVCSLMKIVVYLITLEDH